MSDFVNIIQKYRKESFSEKAKGTQFERLIKAFLLTSPKYAHLFSDVWLWEEFPARNDFGGKDVGIDIVCRTNDSDFWAVQCKCYKETVRIAKPDVDTFLSTSSRTFIDADTQNAVQFSYRLWIDTTVKGFNPEAENTIHNQIIPVGRINLYDLENSGVDWNLLENGSVGKEAQTKKYLLKEHQSAALQSVHTYFQTHDRGKLIMACGTGKTFTSLKIAENETMHSGLVLFLVPSIALLGQTLNEWSAQSLKPIHPLCICSDTHVSKNNKANDASGVSSIDLALPASTNIKNITRQYKRAIKNQKKNGGMVVVFSTYQSIDVISSVQEKLNEQESHSCIFDLIICDEAHRTTGVTLKDKEESHFVKVHKNVNIEAKKRLYMTATPRLYGENSIKKAQEKEAEL
ncbi:MAG: DEAD/DEAH box helicase family protein, partial [Spirochaetales bacterium]